MVENAVEVNLSFPVLKLDTDKNFLASAKIAL